MKWPLLPDYGCLPRWPQDGVDFVHPDDISVARSLVPSSRVFRREEFDGTYYRCSYGANEFRLRPCLWVPVQCEGLDIGDFVEVKGFALQRDLFVAYVRSMRLGPNGIQYGLARGQQAMPNKYHAHELRLLDQKQRIEPREFAHPTMRWNGDGERLQGIEI